jgi:hypothetical protein
MTRSSSDPPKRENGAEDEAANQNEIAQESEKTPKQDSGANAPKPL